MSGARDSAFRALCCCAGLSPGIVALGVATAQETAGDANKSNNPLSAAASLGLQNYYTPSLFGSNAHTNDFLVRPTVPLAPGDWIKVPQILRGAAQELNRHVDFHMGSNGEMQC